VGFRREVVGYVPDAYVPEGEQTPRPGHGDTLRRRSSMSEPRTHERLVISMATVFDVMDAATLDAWVGLTGLQIQLVRVVATDRRIDRVGLALWTRTSRAALVPSLAALLQRRILAEEVDEDGPHLVLAPAGRRLLEEVLDARVAWLRDAATAARPPVDDDDVRHAIALMERLANRG
jgi:hypothetical protein